MSRKGPSEARTASSRRAFGALSSAALLAVALLIAALPSAGAEKEQPPSAATSGLVEKTGVELVLLDIEAVDAEGRPLRGLQVGDFIVRRNGRLWTVVSVDDFCACADPAGAGLVPAAAQAAAADAHAAPAAADVHATPPPPPGDHPLFVIYLDFGQLRPDGRHDALEAARHWVREIKAEDEPAMIAAYITSRGLLNFSNPTSDRDRLLEVIDGASYHPPRVREPSGPELFPGTHAARLGACPGNRHGRVRALWWLVATSPPPPLLPAARNP